MYAPGMFWKMTWPPLIHASAVKIVPLVVRIHHGFCKMIWYCSILFYFESFRSIMNQRKHNNFFTGLNVFLRALNFRFWQVSQTFDLFIDCCRIIMVLLQTFPKLQHWWPYKCYDSGFLTYLLQPMFVCVLTHVTVTVVSRSCLIFVFWSLCTVKFEKGKYWWYINIASQTRSVTETIRTPVCIYHIHVHYCFDVIIV